MKISEFVRDVINEICDGVREAAHDVALKTQNHPIAPNTFNGKITEGGDKIHFEISTTVREEKNLEGGVKSEIVVVNADINKSQTNETLSISKISFSVPIDFRANKKPR